MSPSGVTWSCGKIWSSMTAICLCWFVVSTESLVMLMYQVNVGSLSTNVSMHIVVRLIHVHPYLSRHIQCGH